MPCPPVSFDAFRALRLVRVALALCAAAPALHAQTTRAPDPFEPLRQQVQQWVAARQSLPVTQVRVAPVDPRLQLASCAQPLQLDQPFSAPTTVRARCAKPEWQLFLRVQLDGPADAVAGPVRAAGLPADAPVARASAEAGATRPAVVASRMLRRGSLLGQNAVEMGQVPSREADASVLTDVKDLQWLEATRDIAAGAALRSGDVKPAILVRQGQLVLFTVGGGGGFVVSVRLEALQDGRHGDQILLRNRESGRSVTGVVTGINTAQGT